MIEVALLLLCQADPQVSRAVGVRIEEIQGLSDQEAQGLAEGLGKGIERATGGTAVIDSQLWSECQPGSRCLSEIRARTGAKDVVFLKAFAAATRVRIVAERVETADVVVRQVQVDIPRSNGGWGGTLDHVATILFPDSQLKTKEKDPLGIATPPPPKADSMRPLVGWSAVGAGAVATGFGVLFRVTGNAAKDSVANDPLSPEEVEDKKSSASTQLTASNFLFGGGAVLLTAGLVLLFTGP